MMWAMIGSAITMPVAFLIGSKWGTTGIAAAWLAAYPIIIAPVYHRIFQKTGMTAREYLGNPTAFDQRLDNYVAGPVRDSQCNTGKNVAFVSAFGPDDRREFGLRRRLIRILSSTCKSFNENR